MRTLPPGLLRIGRLDLSLRFRPEFGFALALVLFSSWASLALWLSLHLTVIVVLAMRHRTERRWARPGDGWLSPWLMGLASLALVVLTGLTAAPIWLAGHVLAALAMGWSRPRRRTPEHVLGEGAVGVGLLRALEHSHRLALEGERLRAQLCTLLGGSQDPEALGQLELCCERLWELPTRLAEQRLRFELNDTVRRQALALDQRLIQERLLLHRDSSPTLRRQRSQLVEQLRRNLEVARSALDEVEARLLALESALEGIQEGWLHLQRHLSLHGVCEEAMAPVADALDRIEDLLALP